MKTSTSKLPKSPLFESVLYRTYSKKKEDGHREPYPEICDRVVPWIAKVGKLTDKEQRQLDRTLRAMKIIVAGRILWVGGTEWSEDPDNVYGGYNCNSTIMDSPGAFGRLMNLAMQGVGTGAVLEQSVIAKLPAVRNRLVVTIQGKPGDTPKVDRQEKTSVNIRKEYNRGVESPKRKTIVTIKVGDSRTGWWTSYQALIDLAFKSDAILGGGTEIHVVVDVSDVRPYGERLKRFGGVANPAKLSEMYLKIADIINEAQGRQLTSVECCLLIDEAASTIVSGNIRRCLTKTTLVQADKGLVPIAEIEVGDRVLTSKGYHAVSNKFRQGLQSIWVIHTDGLGTIECSGDHKIAISNAKNKGYQMVKAKDVRVGDRLVTVQESDTKTYIGSVKIVKIEPNLFAEETFDIEVEKLHQFVIGEGLLVSNSAGMRQYSWDDILFGKAKQNLWQQDAQGNWKIDPKRDALRMANHSRVYHHKPTLEECIDAVRSQYLSGEGAIQWAREAIARANADILQSKAERDQLLNIHQSQVKEFLRLAYIHTYKEHPSERELQHRCDRIGLNPCVTGDTWVHTEEGPHRVRDLIGVQHKTYVNGELFETTPEGFFSKGVKPVVKVTTKEGFSIRLTGNHKLLAFAHGEKVWKEAQELKAGDKVCLHNHRAITSWGTEDGQKFKEIGREVEHDMEAVRKEYLENYSSQSHPRSLEDYWADISLTDVRQDIPIGAYSKDHAVTVVRGVGCRGEELPNIDWEALEKSSYDTYYQFFLGFFADWFADPYEATENYWRSLMFTHTHPIPDRHIAEVFQRMLLRMGIVSTIESDRNGWHQLHFTDSTGRFAGEGLGEATRSELKIDQMAKELRDSALTRKDEYYIGTIASVEEDGEEEVFDCIVPGPNRFDANGFVAHNCGEIIGADMHCNLTEVILPLLSPTNLEEQDEAFGIAAVAVAALLHQEFPDEVYQYSRQIDPIVAVCPTGIFDFFVLSLGVKWLQWWQADRNPNWLQPIVPPQVEEVCEVLDIAIEDYGNNPGQPEFDLGAIFNEIEKRYYTRWRKAVEVSLTEYCDRHKLRRPNRYTAVQPSGTKSLLVNVSPGWHPPKAKRFIRRITFGKNDPVAQTCIDYGYNVVPGQSDKDENGNLLNDPFDPRCSEWLVEIPCAVSWADLPGAEAIAIEKFSAKAQLRAYKNVQDYYTTHNTSGTIELREHEIEELGTMIYEDILYNRGYLSVALLARFDDRQSFPRLPFEQVTQEEFEELSAGVLVRRNTDDFQGRLFFWDSQAEQEQDSSNSGPAGCDSDICLLPGKSDEPEVAPKSI